MKRAQKRYETAQPIEAEIDKVNEAKRSNESEMRHLSEKVRVLRSKIINRDTDPNKARQMRFQVEALQEMMDLIDKRRPLLEQKLLRLKKTLAAFNTVPMPFIDEPSVTLQK